VGGKHTWGDEVDVVPVGRRCEDGLGEGVVVDEDGVPGDACRPPLVTPDEGALDADARVPTSGQTKRGVAVTEAGSAPELVVLREVEEARPASARDDTWIVTLGFTCPPPHWAFRSFKDEGRKGSRSSLFLDFLFILTLAASLQVAQLGTPIPTLLYLSTSGYL
jgi:hypothetical protein